VIHNPGTSHRAESDTVSNAILVARSLERMELARCGTRSNAQRSLANKLRIGHGTLENLIRGRVKSVDASIRDRLQAQLIRELELEKMRLEHELAIARQGGASTNSDEILEVETLLSQARAVLNGIVSGKGKLNERCGGDPSGSS
jgi:hypothetical protein